MAVTRFEVVPAALRTPATDLARTAADLERVARRLSLEGAPDTGDVGASGHVAAALRALEDAVVVLARQAVVDAAALRGAGARYDAAERSATAEVRRCA